MTTLRIADGAELQLVMSDEFNLDGRRFGPDSDEELFQAVHKPDLTNDAIQFCTFVYPFIYLLFCALMVALVFLCDA